MILHENELWRLVGHGTKHVFIRHMTKYCSDYTHYKETNCNHCGKEIPKIFLNLRKAHRLAATITI